jgi:hypothetical protein
MGPFTLRELAFLDDAPFRVARRCGKRAVVALVQLTQRMPAIEGHDALGVADQVDSWARQAPWT